MVRVHYTDRWSVNIPKIGFVACYACEVEWADYKSPPTIKPLAERSIETTDFGKVTCRKCRRASAFRRDRNSAWRRERNDAERALLPRKRNCRGGARKAQLCQCEAHRERRAVAAEIAANKAAREAEEARRFPMFRTRPARPHLTVAA